MLIRVSEIPEDGLSVEGPEAVERPFADLAWQLEALSLHVEKDGSVVSIRGGLTARVPLSCGRCLEPFHLQVECAVDARYEPMPGGRGEGHELGANDLETDWYDKDAIDLAPLVETETSLALPMKPLCRDECRGLCPVCGANRNLTACTCEARTPDPRWAPLKALAERLSR